MQIEMICKIPLKCCDFFFSLENANQYQLNKHQVHMKAEKIDPVQLWQCSIKSNDALEYKYCCHLKMAF